MRVLVMADTHLRSGLEGLPAGALRLLSQVDAVLHAGDVVGLSTLTSLAEVAPLHAVLGNNDLELGGVLPETRTLEFEGVRIGMVHDSGPRPGRPARLRRLFPLADLVVFGHSHLPVDEEGISGQLLFNPGSPTQRRSQPHHTVGELRLEHGRIIRRAIIPV